jgi:hypothetical protein
MSPWFTSFTRIAICIVWLAFLCMLTCVWLCVPSRPSMPWTRTLCTPHPVPTGTTTTTKRQGCEKPQSARWLAFDKNCKGAFNFRQFIIHSCFVPSLAFKMCLFNCFPLWAHLMWYWYYAMLLMRPGTKTRMTVHSQLRVKSDSWLPKRQQKKTSIRYTLVGRRGFRNAYFIPESGRSTNHRYRFVRLSREKSTN